MKSRQQRKNEHAFSSTSVVEAEHDAKTSKDEDKVENAEQDKAKHDDTDLANFNNSLRGLIE